MTAPTIRPASAADIAAITAIYAPAVLTGTASFELEPPSEAEMLARFESLAVRGFPYIVAEREGRIAGYAYAGPYRPRPAYRHTVENSVYVDPARQRLGVGRALLADLIARASEQGFRQMIAVIGDSAQGASIGLHRGLGFVHCGIVRSVGYKHGRWLDQVIMQRPLGAGDGAAPERW
jgi:phosphinothricin acetyltransferase